MSTIVFWIDQNIDNEENQIFIKNLKSMGSLRLQFFSEVEKAIESLKYIEFLETKIIISDSLYSKFKLCFRENVLEMCVSPKIIVFTKDKKRFLENERDYKSIENKFYTFGGIATKFDELKNFLIDKKIKQIKKREDIKLTVEYIDKKEKLMLPIFFKPLIDNISYNELENYNNSLCEDYSNENYELEYLLNSIESMSDIPEEILSKYYSRLYTANSNFYKDINKNLEKYIPFIKVLYKGIKLKSLPLANNYILYKGAKIPNEEIIIIKKYLNNKKEGLPGCIIFSESFLTFSKDKNISKKYFNIENKDDNLSKVLFILKKDDNVDYSLSTHSDIEKISFFPYEREVLFLPFSSFEIKNIKEININEEKAYEIELIYLSKYYKDIESDIKLINSEILIPDSQFKKSIEEIGLITDLKNMNTKKIYNKYKKYEKEINNKYVNLITGEIYIKPENINKDIQILNSYENVNKGNKNADDKNEKELKDNILIKINEKMILFSYVHKFEKEGKYKIEYSFRNNLTKTNHMFCDCNFLTNLDLSNFKTEDITNMSYMFCNCNSLINLDLSTFKTQKVTNMCQMFYGCNSLINLDLSKFNTENVTDMSYMFNCCKCLKNLNLSSFDIQNVTDMRGMFSGCESLINLNLSNFITHNVTNMYGLFYNCSSLINLDLSNFNTINVIDMNYMFYNCSSLTDINLTNFNTTNVISMNDMFNGCKSLKNLDLSNFNTEKVTDMRGMFQWCNSLINLNISNFNTKNVTKMNRIFHGCKSLKNLDLTNFNTKNVIDMSKMFMDCNSLINLDLSNFNTQNSANMSYMFYGCKSLKSLDLSNFNFKKSINMNYMFYGCLNLQQENLKMNKDYPKK